MKLFHCPFSRAFRVAWLLNELDIDHQLDVLTYPPRASQEFGELNKLNTVPFLQTDGHSLIESTAILIYLSGKHSAGNLALTPDEADYPEWLDMIAFGETGLAAQLSLMLHYSGNYPFDPFMPEPKRIDCVLDYYTDRFRMGVEHIADRLEEHSFLVGDRFTAADISVGYTFQLAEAIGSGALLEPVQAYWQRLQERDGYRSAVAAEQAGIKVQS